MTPWEREIVLVVANHLRMLSLDQVARTWWPGQSRARRAARESVRALAKRGWLNIDQVLSRPIVPLLGPLVDWRVGQQRPGFDDLARQLRRRARAAARLTTVVSATEKSCTFFGSGKRPARIKLTQMTHDLHVGEVFLAYRESGFDMRGWVSEDDLPNTWSVQQRPDAVLIDVLGVRPQWAVEYGGDYTAKRLMALHAALSSIGMPYEIW